MNHRMVAAARYILQGSSLKQALIRGGYAESTARKPRANGLTAERCLAELAKTDPSADPMTLVGEARRVALRAVRALGTLPEAKLLEGRSLGAVAKLWDTAERFHGGGAESPGRTAARTLVERAAEMRAVLDELDRRGLLGAAGVGAPVVIDVAHRSESHAEPPQLSATAGDTSKGPRAPDSTPCPPRGPTSE